MSNVIQFLEAMGSRPAPSAAEYAAIVAGLEINDAQRRALLDADHAALNALLDGRAKMYCYVATPNEKEPEPESVPDDADGDDDGVPDRDEPDLER